VVFTPAACVVGALGMVCYGGPVEAPAQMFDEPGFAEFEAALAWLDGFLSDRYGFASSYDFNDAKGRTVADVILALGEAADDYDADTATPVLVACGCPADLFEDLGHRDCLASGGDF